MSEHTTQTDMEKIVSLAKRRGFVFQGSEIYGGLAGTYDYGPLGVLLKNNIRDNWIEKFVSSQTNMYLLDSAILMHPRVWETTGHVDKFVDPLVEDIVTHKRYRADHLLEEAGVSDASSWTPQQMNDFVTKNNHKSPEGNPLGPVRTFNMMLSTKVGTVEDSASVVYLRPETAQGIFLNYKNVMDSFHPKLPFGIAQVGKAFRNEITPRDFIFRVREFEQMEIEYFIHGSQWKETFTFFQEQMLSWITSIGIDSSKIHCVDIPDADRAHYSQRTIDFEFEYPFGQKELFGLAYRTDYDLARHMQESGARLEYVDEVTQEKFIPHVIEPSCGLERAVLAVLLSAYREDTAGDDVRVFLDLPAHIAPYTVAVSPLLKNKEKLWNEARDVFEMLKKEFHHVVWDDHGNIGKRYRRQDEIGTPFCVVIDFDSLEDKTVTIRDRNTTEQIRISKDDLAGWIRARIT